MAIDIFHKRNSVVLGKIKKELKLARNFGLIRYRWSRVWFKSMKLDTDRQLNGHMMITGESGAGKSNAAKLILKQLAGMGANFIILDPHSEYAEHAKDIKASTYDAGIHAVNVFDLDGLTERERTAEITSMFRRIFHLGEVQAYTLYKAVQYTYYICMCKEQVPNIHSLLYTIKVFKKHAGKAEANVLEGLEKRLQVIAGESFQKSVSMQVIMHQRSIFSLASLHSAEAQTVYMESMLKRIYSSMLAEGPRRQGRQFYVVIDEAERLQDTPVIARLVAEGRKYGVGLVAISQRAKALDKDIRSNAATMIAFAQREPEEQNYMANMIAAGTEYNRFIEVRKALRELPRGWALVQEARERNPKMVKCGRFDARTRDPSHRIIELARRVISKQELLRTLEKEGFSQAETINTIKELVKTGLLKYHFVTEPPYGGIWYIAMPRNSAEHDIMVNLISRYLTENGVKNTIYNNSFGPDVIAYRDGKRVAVEYETGKKFVGDTEKMLEMRKKTYSEIVVL